MTTSNIKLDELIYTQARWPVVMVYQLTSPRTIQAFLVVLFGFVVAWLTFQGQEVPNVAVYVLMLIVGYYFADKDTSIINGLRNGVASRVSDVVAQQAAVAVLGTDKLAEVPSSVVGETAEEES